MSSGPMKIQKPELESTQSIREEGKISKGLKKTNQ